MAIVEEVETKEVETENPKNEENNINDDKNNSEHHHHCAAAAAPTDTFLKDDSSNELLAFKTLCNFVNALVEVQGEQCQEIQCYNHLLKNTKVSDTTFISRHVALFKEYCVKNREAIEAKDWEALSEEPVTYSKQCFIPLKRLLEQSKDRSTAWKHILFISSLVDPESKAKETLKNKTNSKEEKDFIHNIIHSVEQTVTNSGNNPDPMSCISSLLTGGTINTFVNDLQSGVNSGSIDIQNLLGSVQVLLSEELPRHAEADPAAAQQLAKFNVNDGVDQIVTHLSKSQSAK